jgi:hypothetical protein
VAGRVRWRTLLSDTSVADESTFPALQPLAAGPAAVFTENGSVVGLALASGRRLWSYPGLPSVLGRWQWRGVLVILSDVAGRLVAVALGDGRRVIHHRER